MAGVKLTQPLPTVAATASDESRKPLSTGTKVLMAASPGFAIAVGASRKSSRKKMLKWFGISAGALALVAVSPRLLKAVGVKGRLLAASDKASKVVTTPFRWMRSSKPTAGVSGPLQGTHNAEQAKSIERYFDSWTKAGTANEVFALPRSSLEKVPGTALAVIPSKA